MNEETGKVEIDSVSQRFSTPLEKKLNSNIAVENYAIRFFKIIEPYVKNKKGLFFKEGESVNSIELLCLLNKVKKKSEFIEKFSSVILSNTDSKRSHAEKIISKLEGSSKIFKL